MKKNQTGVNLDTPTPSKTWPFILLVIVCLLLAFGLNAWLSNFNFSQNCLGDLTIVSLIVFIVAGLYLKKKINNPKKRRT